MSDSWTDSYLHHFAACRWFSFAVETPGKRFATGACLEHYCADLRLRQPRYAESDLRYASLHF